MVGQVTVQELCAILNVPQSTYYRRHRESKRIQGGYQQAIKAKGIIMSMSRKGTPAGNAPIESFHATIKAKTFYFELQLPL
ncbi:hypothetical protein J1907_13075 [Lysinibacillus sphaericus]|nr:hypothetical protein J2B92_10075 [Lysinibacillus sphaericus]QTB20759.1 hypothetical protein J1907_13075 [Lysinibacillus sphaericus]